MTAGNEIVPLEDIPNDQDGTDNRDGMAGTIDGNRNGMDEIDIIVKPAARPTTLNVRIQSEKKKKISCVKKKAFFLPKYFLSAQNILKAGVCEGRVVLNN